MARWFHAGAKGRQGKPAAEAHRAAQLSALCALLVLLAPLAPPAAAPDLTNLELIFTQAPFQARRTGTPVSADPRPERARIVRLVPGYPLRVLTAEFASACDPALSFDAKHVLFAAKRRPRDKWNIWEMAVDGTGKRQITNDFGNCTEPRYLALSSITPPDYDEKVRWIAFVSDAAGTRQEQGDGLATALYARNIEPIASRGTVTWRTTYNLSSDFSPVVLKDGRVLFTSHQAGGGFPLFMTNWDGTVLSLFYGDARDATINTMSAEMPDRTLVFVESAPGERGGRLARVYFKRPLHSHEILSKVPGQYHSPTPISDGTLLVSYSSGTGSFGIRRFDFAGGGPGPALFDDPKWDNIQAQPVRARPEPTGLLSAVVDSAATADLQCMNVYDSDLPDMPARGQVKTVRLVEGVPLPAVDRAAGALSSNVRTRVLGEAPVEEDGSFYVTVPGDTPFNMQLLGAGGTPLKEMRTWVWVRRGTSRGCPGCHENREYAPENVTTMALRKHNPAQLLTPPDKRPWIR